VDQIPFYKMSGSGNDFIIIDNREKVVPEDDLQGFIARICRRKMSVGADGLILVENTEQADFKWRFYNSDGSVAEMCGNGARCVARFAYQNGIVGERMSFETLAGVVHAEVIEKRVKISMPDPFELILDENLEIAQGNITMSNVNTGVPHVVIETPTLDKAEVVALGREIRHHSRFSPAGTNVNFVSAGSSDNMITIRTYERGVEDETLACGTGAVAASIVRASKSKIDSPVKVLTRSGEQLMVYFDQEEGTFSNIYLEGDARIIYRGNLWSDAWDKPLIER
jgi:diaminopimelate epimerase